MWVATLAVVFVLGVISGLALAVFVFLYLMFRDYPEGSFGEHPG